MQLLVYFLERPALWDTWAMMSWNQAWPRRLRENHSRWSGLQEEEGSDCRNRSSQVQAGVEGKVEAVYLNLASIGRYKGDVLLLKFNEADNFTSLCFGRFAPSFGQSVIFRNVCI